MDAAHLGKPPEYSQFFWPAELDVHFEKRGDKTVVAHVAHFGPLRIQRPFYPETQGTAHLYLLHPPGGVAGGDALRIGIECGEAARALVTTPAATKLYKTAGDACSIQQVLKVQSGGFLEWLPQETIAFSNTHAEVATVVELEEEAQFVGWEVLCLGRPASGDSFSKGRLKQKFEVWRDGIPLYLDRLRLDAMGDTRNAAWGLGGGSVVGTMVIACSATGLVPLIRHCLEQLDLRHKIACTELDGVVLVRFVGDSVRDCWRGFVSVWETVRPVLCGAGAVLPRIWNC